METESEKRKFSSIKKSKRSFPVLPVIKRKYVTYRIVRSTSFSIRGKRIHFQFFNGNTKLFHVKLKALNQEEPIPIGFGNTVHYSGSKQAGMLLSGSDYLSFSLRENGVIGKEIMSVVDTKANKDYKMKRNIEVNLFEQNMNLPKKLVSKNQKISDDDSNSLDFHQRPSISSIRNVILVDETMNNEFIVVRKIDKDIFDVDANNLIDPIIVFGFVLTLFISNA